MQGPLSEPRTGNTTVRNVVKRGGEGGKMCGDYKGGDFIYQQK
jgi:hypothetical protein